MTVDVEFFALLVFHNFDPIFTNEILSTMVEGGNRAKVSRILFFTFSLLSASLCTHFGNDFRTNYTDVAQFYGTHTCVWILVQVSSTYDDVILFFSPASFLHCHRHCRRCAVFIASNTFCHLNFLSRTTIGCTHWEERWKN